MSERYYSFSTYCKNTFGRKLNKVALNAKMTCPNRDGTIDTRGCIFCGKDGSGDFAIDYEGQGLTIQDLIYNHQDAKPGDYIAYFQAYTNTYAPIERLEKLFESALQSELFQALFIATRPDCLEEDVLDLLASLQQKYPNKKIVVELGLQTIHEDSAHYIRRGYPLPIFDQAIKALHKRNIDVIVHVIIGLPNETKEMMLETISYLNTMPIQGIKLQLLHVLDDTDLAKDYKEGKFEVLDFDCYIDIIVNCIQLLRSDIVIHRLSGDGNQAHLLAPLWSKDKRKVLNAIQKELKKRNIKQGENYVKNE